jgi:hypothetical protein
MNGLGKLKADVVELRRRVDTDSAKGKEKDVWEKLGALSGLFSSVILGGAGLIATSLYNQHQLALQKKDEDSKQHIESVQMLEKLWHYLTSADPREREFGYAMYASFGEEKLALKVIALTRDAAGSKVAEGLKASKDATIRQEAAATLLTLQQQKSVLEVVKKHEGQYDAVFGDGTAGQDLRYGIGFWGVKSGGLTRLLTAYSEQSSAQYSALAKKLLEGGSVRPSAALSAELKTLSLDPVMRQAQDEQFRKDFVVPGSLEGQKLGLKLPLSIAILCDLAVNLGWKQTESLTNLVTAKLGGNPAKGADEKTWDMALLDARADRILQLVSAKPSLARFQTAWMDRVESLRKFARDGNWNLTAAEVQPQLAGAPD